MRGAQARRTKNKDRIARYEELVLSDKKSSFVAARELLNSYFEDIRK